MMKTSSCEQRDRAAWTLKFLQQAIILSFSVRGARCAVSPFRDSPFSRSHVSLFRRCDSFVRSDISVKKKGLAVEEEPAWLEGKTILAAQRTGISLEFQIQSNERLINLRFLDFTRSCNTTFRSVISLIPSNINYIESN